MSHELSQFLESCLNHEFLRYCLSHELIQISLSKKTLESKALQKVIQSQQLSEKPKKGRNKPTVKLNAQKGHTKLGRMHGIIDS